VVSTARLLRESERTGFRALARKHHPDVGGSTPAMQALTDAHEWLQENESSALDDFAYAPLSDDDIPY
jgi:hypothetical protein